MRYLIIALSVLALSACSETIMLSKPGDETAATGTLKFRLNPPHRFTITLAGKLYEGDMDSKEVDNSAELDKLRKRYGPTSKHYVAILSGLNTTHHVHHYKGVLKASDDATLICDFLSSNDGGRLGACDDGKGQIYEVHKSRNPRD